MKEYILGEFKSLNRSQYLEGLVFTIARRGYPNKKNTKNKKVVLISGNSYLGQQHQKTEGVTVDHCSSCSHDFSALNCLRLPFNSCPFIFHVYVL